MSKTRVLPFNIALMEAIKDMVFMVNVTDRSALKYEFFNRAVFERTHLAQQDIGKTFQETHAPAAAGILNGHYEKVLETEGEIIFEDTYVSPAGEHYYSETTLTPLFDETGMCSHVIGVVKDTTGERLAKMASEEAWERLKESRSRYRSLYENNADAIFSLDLKGRILAGNSTVEQLTSYPMNDLIGTDFSKYIPQKDCELLSMYIQLALSGTSNDFRTIFIGNSRQSIGILVHFAPIEVKNEIVGVYATLKDMRELDKVSSQYLESENRFRIIAENAHDVIVLMDHEGETIYVSPSSKRVYGLEPEEYLERPPFYNVYPEDIPQVRKAFSLAIQEAQTYILEARLQHKTRGWIWTEVQGIPIFDEQHQFVHMLTITQDITLHKERETQLQYDAYHDSLTGLPNRRFLKESILEKINHSSNKEDILTVFLLDIDHFKAINDQLGHDVGDAVIEEFGKRLLQSTGDGDVAARLGGDEFILLLPGIKTADQAEKMAQKIQVTMAQSWENQDVSLKVSASMGIALTPLAGADVSTILKNADIAMYESKEAGRGTYRIRML
ncbi:sensor domain-containing protein [Metaplanococcus flavidus]|uniref:Diguanylate cyclase domain-containing protein n=1 Tax=Metaplanococcus flavidus TaxID=569883 RepID=A0ABW3LDH4_9BACL